MELRVNSPSVKPVSAEDKRTMPVFGDGDKIGGMVILDPSCSPAGRLTVSVSPLMSYVLLVILADVPICAG